MRLFGFTIARTSALEAATTEARRSIYIDELTALIRDPDEPLRPLIAKMARSAAKDFLQDHDVYPTAPGRYLVRLHRGQIKQITEYTEHTEQEQAS